jgi:hypothetical protein
VQKQDRITARCYIHSDVSENGSDCGSRTGTRLSEHTRAVKATLDYAAVNVMALEAPTEQRDLVIFVAGPK